MADFFTTFVFSIENVLWSFIGVPIVLFLGIYLSLSSNFVHIRKFPTVVKTFLKFFKRGDTNERGVHPLKTFFACIGGSVGVGNVVGVCTAVQLGGPGALFWIWVTATAGAIVKYAEVYLGMLYREQDNKGGYRGGPMYYLQKAFKTSSIATIVSFLLCIYGVEIFQFGVVTKSISHNFELNHLSVVVIMLLMVLFAGSGGVRRVGTIASALIPFFVFTYVGMGTWILLHNFSLLPEIFMQIIQSAFSGHAAVGGFAGSTLMLAASQGVRRGCYSGDIGIGYASVIHSETSATVPEKQASLVIFEIFVDTFTVCTTSVLLVLITGTWQENLEGTMLVQMALSQYFSYMHYFMPLFLFLVGYATINAYFCVGLKCADFISPKMGRKLYFVYAAVSLLFFSFFDPTLAQSVMAIAGGLLLVVNCYGIFQLRKDISYNLEGSKHPETSLVPSPDLAS